MKSSVRETKTATSTHKVLHLFGREAVCSCCGCLAKDKVKSFRAGENLT